MPPQYLIIKKVIKIIESTKNCFLIGIVYFCIKNKYMAKDFYHNNVREALEKDGWKITHDPYPVKIEAVGYEIDFGAEPLMAAEKDERKIAIEVKSFMGPSTINEFHKAVGQFNDYYVAMEIQEPDRVLFLAIPEEIWSIFFQKTVIQKSLQRIEAKIVVYNPLKNEIVKWIK